jgi:hypothetical protein
VSTVFYYKLGVSYDRLVEGASPTITSVKSLPSAVWTDDRECRGGDGWSVTVSSGWPTSKASTENNGLMDLEADNFHWLCDLPPQLEAAPNQEYPNVAFFRRLFVVCAPVRATNPTNTGYR